MHVHVVVHMARMLYSLMPFVRPLFCRPIESWISHTFLVKSYRYKFVLSLVIIERKYTVSTLQVAQLKICKSEF